MIVGRFVYRLGFVMVGEWKPEVRLVSITSDAEELIERAYRNCFQSEMSGDVEKRREFIRRCIKLGHLSPLEFTDAVFEVVCSRVCTHQLVRHRIASYAQESQRRVKVKDLDYVVVPPMVVENQEALEVFLKAVRKGFEAYEKLLELGIRKEDARYVLPQCIKSKILVKMNFRAWRHFLELRCDKTAQWEIREIAMRILEILNLCAPSVFGDLYEKFFGSVE
jgi:thymidylate synthase (FAD)